MNKEILLITNYFPPEKGAAANRMYAMAKAFTARGFHVTVVCPLPNYPEGKIFPSYRGKLWKTEVTEGIRVKRLWIWPSNSGNKLVRLFSMLSFSFSLKLYLIFRRLPKKVFIQYSPVLVGFTAVLWAGIFGKKLILNISDLWPKAGLEMGLLKKGFYYRQLEIMERFCIKRSKLILGQSDEILDHVKTFNSSATLFRYRNYPDFNPPDLTEESANEKIRLVYAGLLGVAQGVYKICTEISFPEHVELHIYGSGPEEELIRSLKNSQIKFHGVLERQELHKAILQYDMAFVPLINRIYGSVPSKIFEYSRLGLPLLYFAGGEGETIVNENELGIVSPAGDIQKLQGNIDALDYEALKKFDKRVVRSRAVQAFDFETQFDELTGLISEL